MKTYLGAFIAFIVALFISTSAALAAMPVESLIQQQGLDRAEERTGILQAIDTSNPKEVLVKNKDILGRKELADVNSPSELFYGEPYRVIVANEDVIQALLTGKPLSPVLSTAPYYWEVPVFKRGPNPFLHKPVASFAVDISEGKWQVVEVGGYLPPDLSAFSSNSKDIAIFLKRNGLTDATSFAHFQILALHTDFIYVATADQEFFVPLIHGRDELYGLRNKKIYTRDEVVATVGPILKAGLNNPMLDSGYAGSGPVPARGKDGRKGNWVIFAGGMGIALLIGYKIYRRVGC